MHLRSQTGKISLAAVSTVGLVLIALFFLNLFSGGTAVVYADDLSTSITVLNTPPLWTVDAEEAWESSTASSTNSGDPQRWTGTATDSNSEDYYLLICLASSTPTANNGAPPDCGGGIGDIWSVSAATNSGSEATVSTTTVEWHPESNAWNAYICDGNLSLPKCNPEKRTGSGNTASPFVVNHRPNFTAIINDSPTLPGVQVQWSATADDDDVLGGGDTVRLIVCKTAGLGWGGCDGGASDTWATSTPIAVASDPIATTTILIPTQDTDYSAYVYVIDDQNHGSADAAQGSDSTLTVDNASPTIDADSITLEDNADGASNPLTLDTANASTTDFMVHFTASDNNSCLTSVAGDELTFAMPSVYRSGVTCNANSTFNPNNCYAADTVSSTTWIYSCTQDAGGGNCTDNTDTTVDWTCTFTLWHIADPTDGASLTDSTWFAENWLAKVDISDDDLASSSAQTATTGEELNSFLAFDVPETAIAYSSLEPGQSTDPIVETTVLQATGNVGLDEVLSGDDMCTNWTGVGTCFISEPATSTIRAENQVYATSSLAYASPFVYTLSSTTPTEMEINIMKSTTTTWNAASTTYWGIAVPSSITQAGDYTGQNTITAVQGEAQDW